MNPSRYFEKLISQRLFFTPFYTPEGATSAGAASAPADSADSSLDSDQGDADSSASPDALTDENVPDELADDPVYQEEMQEFQNSLKQEESSESDSESESESENTEQEDDNSSTEKDEDVKYEYQDTEIDGIPFKADDLKNTPKAVLEGTGKIVIEARKAREERDSLQQQLDQLMESPLIKMSADRIKAGKGNEQINIPDLSNAERNQIAKYVNSTVDGLEESEVAKLTNLVANVSKVIAEKDAQNYVHNLALHQKEAQQTQERKKATSDALLGLSQFNSNLAGLKDVSIWDFYSEKPDATGNYAENKQHPQWETYEKTIKPVVDVFAKKGMGFSQIADFVNKFGQKALYTAAAEELKLPVAFNTEERDRKMIKDEFDGIFNRKQIAKGMPGGSDGKPNATVTGETGAIDRNRLDDVSYVNDLFDNADTDEELEDLMNIIRKKK